jgi:hypothetical protein
MGYQVVTTVLKDGRRFEGVVVVGGVITAIAGHHTAPFAADDIAQIVVTHGGRR